MKAAFYAGATGLMAQQEAMDNIGNNLANSNTNGYKAQTVSFRSLLYNNMYANTDTNPLTGHGVRTVDTGIKYAQSALSSTGYGLDFAIQGDALFAVQANGGAVQYTRDGAFTLGIQNNVPYLVTAAGDFVLDANKQRIQVTYMENGTTINADAVRQKLGLFSFDNPAALQPQANNRYAATAQSGAARAAAATENKVMAGYLERSGVTMMDELTNMISAQRVYQLSAKVIQTADENEQLVNNLRK